MIAAAAAVSQSYSVKFNVNSPPISLLLNHWSTFHSEGIKIETGSRTELLVEKKPVLIDDLDIDFLLSLKYNKSPLEMSFDIGLTSIHEIFADFLTGQITKDICLGRLETTISDFNLYADQNNLNLFHYKLFELLKASFNDTDLEKYSILSSIVKQILQSNLYREINVELSKLKNPAKEKFKDEAKLEDLVDAKMGEVVVRFPPEASGYLHVGHAKAAFVNELYREKYNGKYIFRFDDTNPDKDNSIFQTEILEDFAAMGLKYDKFSRTSDHFDKILDCCTSLIKSGHAYADNTSDAEMKEEREKKVPSKFRNSDINENLKIWEGMIKGDTDFKNFCIRAKIDYQHENGSMRDPVIYRHKDAEHQTTGKKYKVYPTYIFAITIVDSIEGVTHVLRTTEYNDKDAVEFWLLDALNLPKFQIIGYGRLGLMNTILSKRKLTWFVNEKIVSGWDDPRMPTVRGMMRRGLTAKGLRMYIESQGASKNTSMVSKDKLYAFNRSLIEPTAPRFMALDTSKVIKALINGIEGDQFIEIAVNPTDLSKGGRKISVGPNMLLECPIDLADLKVGAKINLISWMNFTISSIDIQSRSITLNPMPEDKDFKNILKMNYVNHSNHVNVKQIMYGDLLSKSVISKDDDFKNFINRNSMSTSFFLAESPLKDLKRSDHLQIYRHGLYIVDEAYNTEKATMTLIKIPE